ncbi:hypothetical protein Tco_1383406 [Tanacetum coccineum]
MNWSPTESKKIEKYIRGFPERIKGNITSSKPATLHEAINMPTFQGISVEAGEPEKNDGAHGELYGMVVNSYRIRKVVTVPVANPARKAFDVYLELIGWISHLSSILIIYKKIILFPLPNGKDSECSRRIVRPKKDLGSLACIKAGEKKLDDICVVRDFLSGAMGIAYASRQFKEDANNYTTQDLGIGGAGDFKATQKPQDFFAKQKIPEWKWEKITMDFVTQSCLKVALVGRMISIWVCCDRLTNVAHFLPIREDYRWRNLAMNLYSNEIEALGTRLDIEYGFSPRKTTVRVELYYSDKVEDTARSRQKCYADKRRKPLEFQVGIECYLRGSVLWDDDPRIDENLRFVEESIEIIERDVKNLKRRRIPLVKVRWNSRQGAEYTWEREDQFRKKYPNLFSKPVPSSGVAT